MGKGQRAKGHSFERTVAIAFRELYPDAKRGLSQTRSGVEVPDIDGTPFWIEAKHRIRCNPRRALDEAAADSKSARSTKPPIAVTKDTGKPAMVTLYLSDFLALLSNTQAPPRDAEAPTEASPCPSESTSASPS